MLNKNLGWGCSSAAKQSIETLVIARTQPVAE